MKPTRTRTPRPARRTAAALLALGLAATGCSSHHGSTSSGTTTSTTAVSSKPFTKRVVRGSAVVTVGSTTWHLQVTTCIVGKDRITAQGDDRKGRTVVATFTRQTPKGSVTVTDGAEAWAAGPVGGTTLSKIAVTATTIKGSGTFAHRTMAIVAGPTVSGTGTGKGAGSATTAPARTTSTTVPVNDHRTAPGSFDLSCSSTTPA